jgi:hypothetical protein
MNDWNYNVCQRLSKSSVLPLSSALLLTIYLFLLSSTQLPLFSSQVFAKQTNFKSVNVKQVNLYSMDTNSNAAVSSNAKAIEKLSDKGMYRVLILSNQSFGLLPKNGFNMELLFLNASSSSRSVIASPSSSPIIIKQLVPVSSFDITIYSNNGKVLWQKTNQTINTATAFEKVTFTNGGDYGSSSGGRAITIQLTNIKPSPVPIGCAIPLFAGSNNSNGISSSTVTRGGGSIHNNNNNNNKIPTDSVTFTAFLAPK